MNSEDDTARPPSVDGAESVRVSTSQGILDNPQVFGLFLDSVDKRIDENIKQRTTRSWNLILAVLAVTATLLTGLFGIFYGEIMEVFERTARETALGVAETESLLLRSGVEDRLQDLQFETELTRLNFLVLSLDAADAFSDREAETILESIEMLYRNATDNTDRRKLEFAVETAAKNFASGNRIDYLEDLEEIAPNLLRESDVALQAMTLVLGYRLLSDVGAPRTWIDKEESMWETYQKYREYSGRARHSGYPELYLVFEMIIRHLEERNRDEISNLILESDELNSTDSNAFVTIMESMTSGVADELPGSDRLAKRTRDFLCAYEGVGGLLMVVARRVELNCQAESGE